ncbi:MAG: hypothetical protein GY859_33775 [Desulfobacterales bacterium]|nr:hypothetical protein [Desulfobacterales bacterium]
MQRIFNQLWSENGSVIPFYFNVEETKIWHPHFAVKYFCAFASHYISFLERDETLVKNPLSLEEIRAYGLSKSIRALARDVDSLLQNEKMRRYDLMWAAAYSAPDRYASVLDVRFLVILDEFQNIARYIYRDEQCQAAHDETMPGSFHDVVESKVAPMLVTGSYVGWLIDIAGKYLQASRLDEWYMDPYLTPEEGLQAVYAYAKVYTRPITNETAAQINRLCMSDPFFISRLFLSNFPGRDLASEKGVIDTVDYEINNRRSRMSKTWSEYIELTLQKVNDRYAKQMLLHLSKHSDRYWTNKELKDTLEIDLPLEEIQKRLLLMHEADVIEWGLSDIQFRGLRDGTLNLILRNRFEHEIVGFAPDLKSEFTEKIAQLKEEKNQLRGMLNNLTGKFAELQLAGAFRARKRFRLSDYFEGVRDKTPLDAADVRNRVIFQRGDGKNMEIDVQAESSCGRVALVEVKKTANKIGVGEVRIFIKKLDAYRRAQPHKKILPAFFSVGGFTPKAVDLCKKAGIGTAERIEFFKK